MSDCVRWWFVCRSYTPVFDLDGHRRVSRRVDGFVIVNSILRASVLLLLRTVSSEHESDDVFITQKCGVSDSSPNIRLALTAARKGSFTYFHHQKDLVYPSHPTSVVWRVSSSPWHWTEPALWRRTDSSPNRRSLSSTTAHRERGESSRS